MSTAASCLSMDIIGTLPMTDSGNRYVLVVGDYFTKWMESYPMANMEAGTVADILYSRICELLTNGRRVTGPLRPPNS